MKQHVLIFDPQGYLAPFTVRAKLFIQKLWQEKFEWDVPLPHDFQQKWYELRNELATIEQVKIPRWVGITTNNPIQIHMFTDASELCYGLAVYVRVFSNGQWHSQLLCSRNRVAPLKLNTIPRLELCVMELIHQMVPKLSALPALKKATYFYWTDSEIVLKWLRKRLDTLKIFVAHRISLIMEVAAVSDIRHVNHHRNSADLLTRGIHITELLQNSLWWCGPEFLIDNIVSWPEWQVTPDTNEIQKIISQESKRKVVRHAKIALVYSAEDNAKELIHKHSSFHQTCLVTAYVFRFLFQLCKKTKYSPAKGSPMYGLCHQQIIIGSSPAEHEINTRGRIKNIIKPQLSAAEICDASQYWIKMAR